MRIFIENLINLFFEKVKSIDKFLNKISFLNFSKFFINFFRDFFRNNFNHETFLKILNKLEDKILNSLNGSFYWILYPFIKLLQFFLYSFDSIIDFKKNYKRAGRNNFLLGKEMLKENKINDAKMRFFLADFFCKNSPIIKFYLAYIYYISGNIKRSTKYINECLFLRKNMQQALFLKKQIEKKNIDFEF